MYNFILIVYTTNADWWVSWYIENSFKQVFEFFICVYLNVFFLVFFNETSIDFSFAV